jgi:peptide/nickel transport system substrate-binding protein
VKTTRRIVLVLLTVAVALAAVAMAGAADGNKKVVFTVGVINDVDTLNPVVGVEVPDYEVWNIQYATLTDKAAADFANIPGLAASWKKSNGGKTYTYTLREGLKWSDGTPLTSEDVAYTINRGRTEEWLNYSSTVANITATAPNPRTVVLTSKVPDPKLPTMDVYILPKHIWEKQDAKAVTKYAALDGVGSGPFTLVTLKRGQFWRLKANPTYWGGAPKVDEVVFRLFNNSDAMVAALKKGEIDAAHQVPAQSFEDLSNTDGIVTVEGEQGGFNEIAVNGGRPQDQRVEGIGNGHPALSDIKFRRAIAHAIDKQTLVDKVYVGLGRPGATVSPSANPKWLPEVPAEKQLGFDLAQAKEILDAAGYKDTNGDGIREMPDGGKNIVLIYMVRSESQTAAPDAEFVSGWLKEIGIGTKLKTVNDSKLTEIIGKGDYDMFEWGWTPFVDPDPELSYFRCNQLSKDVNDPTNYYNDASWCSPAYDADYKAQNVELDPAKRLAIVHRMLLTMYDAAVYNVILYEADLQAYRTDRFTGWVRQPAGTGPVLFSNTSPTYARLTPVASSGDSGGGIGTGAIAGIVVAAVVLLGGAAFLITRRRSADDRE